MAFRPLRGVLGSLILYGMFFSSSGVFAQDSTPATTEIPDRPTPQTPPMPGFSEPTPRAIPQIHKFWDKENIWLFSGIAVFRGLDYASTRNFQARGRTEILLAEDVVNNSAAFAAVEAAGTVTSVGVSYLFHRTGHHKMERWLSIGHIGVTAFGVGWNYSLKSKHPR